jgi:hypothetical protein
MYIGFLLNSFYSRRKGAMLIALGLAIALVMQ